MTIEIIKLDPEDRPHVFCDCCGSEYADVLLTLNTSTHMCDECCDKLKVELVVDELRSKLTDYFQHMKENDPTFKS